MYDWLLRVMIGWFLLVAFRLHLRRPALTPFAVGAILGFTAVLSGCQLPVDIAQKSPPAGLGFGNVVWQKLDPATGFPIAIGPLGPFTIPGGTATFPIDLSKPVGMWFGIPFPSAKEIKLNGQVLTFVDSSDTVQLIAQCTPFYVGGVSNPEVAQTGGMEWWRIRITSPFAEPNCAPAGSNSYTVTFTDTSLNPQFAGTQASQSMNFLFVAATGSPPKDTYAAGPFIPAVNQSGTYSFNHSSGFLQFFQAGQLVASASDDGCSGNIQVRFNPKIAYSAAVYLQGCSTLTPPTGWHLKLFDLQNSKVNIGYDQTDNIFGNAYVSPDGKLWAVVNQVFSDPPKATYDIGIYKAVGQGEGIKLGTLAMTASGCNFNSATNPTISLATVTSGNYTVSALCTDQQTGNADPPVAFMIDP